MSTTTCTASTPSRMLLPPDWSLLDLRHHLGNIPLARIRLYPSPGMATEADALAIQAREGRLFELIDGILVEKAMGTYESLLAALLIQRLMNFVEREDLGVVLGPDGALRILPQRMRIPDVSFLGWHHFPERRLPSERVFSVVPDLAIEILSAGNTPEEMRNKVNEYLDAGVQMIWIIDPSNRTAAVHTRQGSQLLGEDNSLDGGQVLPGFRCVLRELFDRYSRERQ
jgi:Uma2 family endonuclease